MKTHGGHTKRILITGASGLLGANLVNMYRSGYCIIAASRSMRFKPHAGINVQFELTEKEEVGLCVDDCRPDIIIHCAAETRVDFCETHPEYAWRVNVEGTRNVALAAQRVGARLIYVSTDAVYPGNRETNGEQGPVGPVNWYGKTKLAAEGVVATCHDNCLIVRTNIFGWNLKKKTSLFEWILKSLRTGSRVPGFSDIIFSPLQVNHLGEIIEKLMQRKYRGVINIGASDSCSKYQFARMIAQTWRLPLDGIEKTMSTSLKSAAPRAKNTSMNVGELTRMLGVPPPSIASGINRLFHQEQHGYVRQMRNLIVGEDNNGVDQNQ